MNNFFLNRDPILAMNGNNPYDNQSMKDQLDSLMMKYNLMQQNQQLQSQTPDEMGELEKMAAKVSPTAKEILLKDSEYLALDGQLKEIIQEELMSSVRSKVNNNQKALKIIQRQKELIKSATEKADNEERQSLSELNDYMKNYSDMSFNEYKRLKNGESNNTLNTNNYANKRSKNKDTQSGE